MTANAAHDAAVLLDGLSHLQLLDRIAAESRLLGELRRSIARQRAGAARAERTLAAVIEAIEARTE